MMVFSLLEISSFKVVVTISTTRDVKKEIFSSGLSPLDSFSKFKEWKASLQEILSQKLQEIYPLGLVERVPKVIHFVGLQMLHLANLYKSNFGLSLKFCEDFITNTIFTSRGTIDEEAAARELMKESSLNPFLKYKIASYYFLSDFVPSLWQQLRQNEPKFKDFLAAGQKSETPELIWSDYLEEKEKSSTDHELISLTERFLSRAFDYGSARASANASAVKHCYNVRKEIKNKIPQELGISCTHSSGYSLRWLTKLFDKCSFCSNNISSFRRHKIYIDMLVFFLNNISKEEKKDFDITFNVLRHLLSSPFQYLFVNEIVQKGFSELTYRRYYVWLSWIVNSIEDRLLGETYDYRDLLRMFLNKRPSQFKKERMDMELDSEACDKDRIQLIGFILKVIFLLKNFTPCDEDNIDMILCYVPLRDKAKIFSIYGEKFCSELLTRGNYKVAHMVVEKLCFNEEEKRKFKKDLIFSLFMTNVIREEKIDLADEYFNWASNGEDTDDLKAEYFSQIFRKENYNGTPIFLDDNISFSFLNQILKWFLHSEDKVNDFKMSIQFDDEILEKLFSLVHSKYYKKCDECLNWLNYSEDKKNELKGELLKRSFFTIIMSLIFGNSNNEKEIAERNSLIYYLCLDNNEKVQEIFNTVCDWCNNPSENPVCPFCRNGDHIYSGDDPLLYCRKHNIQFDSAFCSKENSSVLLKCLPFFEPKQEETIKNVTKRKDNMNLLTPKSGKKIKTKID